jgi:PAS domain S-box-containing protein
VHDTRLATAPPGSDATRDDDPAPAHDAAEILGGIVALSSDAVISLDEAQRITLFNRAAEEIFGWAAEEMLGRPLDLLLPARFVARHRTEHMPAFAASPVAARRMGERRTVYGRRKSGEEFPAEVAIARTSIGGHVRYTAVLRDVTERRRQEEALRASEARYRTLIEAAHDGVFVCDAANRFVLVNPAFAAMCGRTADELLGRGVAELVAPEDIAAAPLRRAELERTGRLETRRTLLRPDGTRVDVELGVTRLDGGEVQCLVRDVTERMRMEEALRERERRFRGIFDSAFQFVALLAPDGTLLECNRTALDFVGLELEDVAGWLFWETPWWSHSLETQRRMREAVAEAAGGAFVRFETEHVGAGGVRMAIDFSLKPIPDAHGAVTLLIAEGRDVTEAKRMAALLRESEATFRSAFEHSGIGMALVELDGG